MADRDRRAARRNRRPSYEEDSAEERLSAMEMDMERRLQVQEAAEAVLAVELEAPVAESPPVEVHPVARASLAAMIDAVAEEIALAPAAASSVAESVPPLRAALPPRLPIARQIEMIEILRSQPARAVAVPASPSVSLRPDVSQARLSVLSPLVADGEGQDASDPAAHQKPYSLVDDKARPPFATLKSAPTGFQYLQQRQYGQVKSSASRLYEEHVSCQLPKVLMEREFQLGTMNKIFASKWLNEKQVVFGTKCNQVVVMDTRTGQMTMIPTLQSSEESIAAQQPCGIHGISINPSGTMLATGASNTNDIGVYKLPTFDPLCVGEGAHTDWVFDLEWIDDEFLVTGSRDNNMALWRIDDVENSPTASMSCLYVPEYAIKKPLVVKQCNRAQKVRALCVNQFRKEMAVLSLNAYLHLWDIETFDQQWSSRLTCSRENVCMTVSEEKNLYAVGSHSYVTLVDSRKKVCQPIPAKQRERGLCQGIRSLSFKKDIITIGTGMGVVLFFDVRAMKYLDNMCGHPCQLAVGPGWLREDENYRDIFFGHAYPNAIYTHAYDDSGIRLFTAGGPLPAGLWGNYAALWT